MPPLGPHLLGRVAPVDDRHLALHPFAKAAPRETVEVVIPPPKLSAYDQGATPRCVAYSTSRVMNKLNGYAFDADWLYARCKEIDGFPTGDGTNARAACDVLRTLGHWRVIKGKRVKAGPQLAHGIQSNTWATDVDSIRAVFARAEPQPVLIGIDWFDAWFKPEPYQPAKGTVEYALQPLNRAGSVVGGHEIGIWACSDRRQAFGLRNTWGSAWPSLVWMAYDVMTQLFAMRADACIINDRSTR